MRDAFFLKITMLLMQEIRQISRSVFVSIVTLYFCLPSCQQQSNPLKGQNSPGSHQLIKVDSLDLVLDTGVVKSAKLIASFSRDQEKILYLHRDINKASIYDLTDQELIKVVDFQLDGSHTMTGDIYSAFPVDMDSIFVFQGLTSQLAVSDTSGVIKLVDTISYPTVNRPKGFYVNTTNFRKIQGYEGKLYFPTVHTFWDDFRNTDAVIEVDLETKEQRKILPFPESYNNGWWESYHNVVSTAIKGDTIIASFGSSPTISVFLKDSLLKEFDASSRAVDPDPDYDSRPSSFSIGLFEKYWETIFNKGFYDGIEYDRYRKLYYRFAFGGSNDAFVSPSQIYRNASIIVLDSAFRKITEYKVDMEVYDIGNHFIGPKGLYIFNDERYGLDEDFLTYDVFQVRQIPE
jgi:hypothetical protein